MILTNAYVEIPESISFGRFRRFWEVNVGNSWDNEQSMGNHRDTTHWSVPQAGMFTYTVDVF